MSFPPPGDDTCACLVAHYLGVPLMHVRDMMLVELPRSLPQVGGRPAWPRGAARGGRACARLGAPMTVRGRRHARPDCPRTRARQLGSGYTRAALRASWTKRARNSAMWAFHRAMQAWLGRSQRRGLAPLRARLGLPLGAAGSETCVPWVEVVSANWMFEEPHALPAWQVGRAGAALGWAVAGQSARVRSVWPRPLTGAIQAAHRPRPRARQVMTGPISPHPSRPAIPEPDVAAFADAAAASGSGLVLSSFGSGGSFFGSLLTGEDYTQLALAYADLAPVGRGAARAELGGCATVHEPPTPAPQAHTHNSLHPRCRPPPPRSKLCGCCSPRACPAT